jgi:predicted glycosyltransferase involved in capsule biosynthesis
MKIAVVIPYRYENAERHRAFSWVFDRWTGWKSALDLEITVSDSDPSKPFNRAEARNNGVRESEGGILVLCDADTFGPYGSIRRAISMCSMQPWVLPYNVYYNLAQDATELVLSKPPAVFTMPSTFSTDHRILDSVGGMQILTRAQWWRTNGHDERFVGWGYEDNDFANRANAVLGGVYRLAGPIYHLWHPRQDEQNFGQPAIDANRERMYRNRREIEAARHTQADA